MKKTLTMILIANGSQSKFYSHDGPGKGLAALENFNMKHDVLHAKDIQADKPGRTHDSQGGQRHAMEYSSDPQDTDMLRFAREIAERTENAMNQINADRIIVVSSPHMLANLRRSFSSSVQKKLLAEIDKDLTKIPDMELPSHLNEVLIF